MISSYLGLPLLCFAFWDVWAALGARTTSLETAAPLAMVAMAATIPALLRLVRGQGLLPAPATPLIVLLLAYGLACLCAPLLIRITIATIATLLAAQMAGTGGIPRSPFFGLIVLASPILPSLEFYLAYPMRLISASIAAVLLNWQGVTMALDGVALRAGDHLFEFDAPCAGVRMLWTGCLLASAVALRRGFGSRRYAASLLLAAAFAIFANALRAVSLVYVEAHALPIPSAGWIHPGVGVVAFLFCGAAILFCTEYLARRVA